MVGWGGGIYEDKLGQNGRAGWVGVFMKTN